MFLIAFSTWLVTVLFDRKLVALQQVSCFWASLYTWLNPFWSVKIIDKHKIDRKKVYVMISNHQSLVDILAIYRFFTHYKWVSKVENAMAPFAGWNMRLNRHVLFDRRSKSGIVKMIQDCIRTIKEGSSIMIFPEGTRSKDGNIQRFKDGAFRVALETKSPILPIVLDGSSNALPKNEYIFRNNSKIVVKILDEIPYESFKDKSGKEIAADMHDLISNELDKLRGNRG
jgi:1-acyl-sn-glycerol-3-phosphate acyltransferase